LENTPLFPEELWDVFATAGSRGRFQADSLAREVASATLRPLEPGLEATAGAGPPCPFIRRAGNAEERAAHARAPTEWASSAFIAAPPAPDRSALCRERTGRPASAALPVPADVWKARSTQL